MTRYDARAADIKDDLSFIALRWCILGIEKTMTVPSIGPVLHATLPTAFPRAIEVSPLAAAPVETSSSGRVVQTLTKVAPIINSGITAIRYSLTGKPR